MPSQISELHQQQNAFFSSGKSKDVAYRKNLLKKLKNHITQREDDICNALYSDFKKPKFEGLAAETQFVLAELNYIIKNLEFWAKPKRVSGSLSSFPSKDWIQYEPLGKVLVISPWNYPFMLAISPLIGAVAAGNCVVLKPSELSPATSKILVEIVDEVFEPGHVSLVEGGVDVAQELLSLKWDHIFFTGSTRVGKIVYKSAAEHLTPVTLELGGKNPCIVDESAAIDVTARRIAWGKFLNAGQTCLAPDYLLVHQSIKDVLIDELKKVTAKFYGDNVESSPDFARIATSDQYESLKKMVQNDNVIWGGQFNDDDRFIAPTLVDEPSLDSKIMEDEIFGPVLPIYAYVKNEELDTFISRYGKPLSLYVFSKRKKFQTQILKKYSFGGGAINDCVLHIANKRMPFGGIGDSGFGGYHGEHSFYLFSHKKSIIKKPFIFDLPMRYPPYTLSEKWMKKLKYLM